MAVRRVVLVLAMVSSFMLPSTALADHGNYGCYEGECSDQEYDQWNNEDRNRNRGRNRGAFSPGPFDDSPVDIRDNNVCISPDCSRRGQEEQK